MLTITEQSWFSRVLLFLLKNLCSSWWASDLISDQTADSSSFHQFLESGLTLPFMLLHLMNMLHVDGVLLPVWFISSHYLLIELISWAEPLQSRTWWLFSQRVDQRRDLLGTVFLPGFTFPVNQTGYNEEVCPRTENRARSGWKERKDLILAAWSSACDRTHTKTPI